MWSMRRNICIKNSKQETTERGTSTFAFLPVSDRSLMRNVFESEEIVEKLPQLLFLAGEAGEEGVEAKGAAPPRPLTVMDCPALTHSSVLAKTFCCIIACRGATGWGSPLSQAYPGWLKEDMEVVRLMVTAERMDTTSRGDHEANIFKELEKKLKELKSKRLYGPKAEEPPELIDPGYYPQTTNGEYGWLCYNPEFQLEDVGAYPNTRQYFRQLFGDSEN
ncbi:hypothetical protein AAG570_010672 [Ranatra chinensis]|uniref:Uncharacterized protein n=1 Tax=Ranatra chinensis TaxID=642074 RepID=A0ABD0YN84_9HEMI